MLITKGDLFEKMVIDQEDALLDYFGLNDSSEKTKDDMLNVKNFHIVAVNSDKVLTVLFNGNCGLVMVYTNEQIINEFDNFSNFVSLVKSTFGFTDYDEIIDSI